MTFPLCVGCHDQIDRVPLDQWGVEFYGVLAGFWSKSTLEERLFVLKIIKIMTDGALVEKRAESSTVAA